MYSGAVKVEFRGFQYAQGQSSSNDSINSIASSFNSTFSRMKLNDDQVQVLGFRDVTLRLHNRCKERTIFWLSPESILDNDLHLDLKLPSLLRLNTNTRKSLKYRKCNSHFPSTPLSCFPQSIIQA